MDENKNDPDAKEKTVLSEDDLMEIAMAIRRETNEKWVKMTKAEKREFLICQQQEAVKTAEAIGTPIVSFNDLCNRKHGDNN